VQRHGSATAPNPPDGVPIRIHLFQRVWSYLEPVTLGESTSPLSGRLELLLVRNQLFLRTDGALYSEGKRYLPALTLAKHLGGDLRRLKAVLVLGVGIGSSACWRSFLARRSSPAETIAS
jgi:hypothetical protein